MSRISGRYLNSAFSGCACIGVIDGQHFKGDIEVYELGKLERRTFVGAWYPDMALMIWPISWYWDFEAKGEVGPPPGAPRNDRMILRSDGTWDVRRKSLKGVPAPAIEDGVKRKPLLGRKRPYIGKRKLKMPKRR